ncbi:MULTISPECIES: TrmH family RNA methyltransferase [Sutcliffiella]|uniref:RNA methyltransferase n=1 Tax=Sutcliffiella cohnii TaxID=33932 RepID=A0A223KU06_9BACI|nr:MULTISPECIES: RNA methyltransferase [Sutcliffiella]AST92803.1 RNA methyltransferase [Sutcliffiella cohnii]MED4016250.1 RNA methyltransferase [Sutcliffiella cohnii]WBL14058.1 RNA methyltransferase [Sutcliffiella sp. NC1]
MKRIDSVKNPKVKQWKKLHKKKEREIAKTFLIEGFHLVEEALKVDGLVEEIIISENENIPANWKIDNATWYIVSDDVLKAISETETPQGVSAVCQFQSNNESMLTKSSKVLMLDNVQDPGNVGTMIRTAEAAGIDTIVLGDGTADLYNGKVVRATQGAIFHVPIIRENLQTWIEKCKEIGIPVYGTALENGMPYTDVKPTTSFALLVGNEGQGVAKEYLSKTDKNLYIPIYGKSESLNVGIAAGILMYYLRT